VDNAPLLEALAASHRLGSLGELPAVAVDASFAFVQQCPDGLVAELGSGGGVPGLVVAWNRPNIELVCLERREQRADHLRRLISRLELTGRVTVVAGDVFLFGREASNRERFDGVITRSFGPPPLVAEAAAPLLRLGGLLLVSEPPDGASRWVEAGTLRVGLTVDHKQAGLQRLIKGLATPPQFPRRRPDPPLF
jgi:16S rRNA (guanine527-N7)-methyltransferase